MAACAAFSRLGVPPTAKNSRFAGGRVSTVTNGSNVCMVQKEKQPEWFNNSKVICNGVEVMTVGGTKSEYVVDIWSGNHPFFQGRSSAIMTDAGRVSKFSGRYGDLGAMSFVETMDDPVAEEDATKVEEK